MVNLTIISGYNLPTDSTVYVLLYGHMWNDFGRGSQDHVLVLDYEYFIYGVLWRLTLCHQ